MDCPINLESGGITASIIPALLSLNCSEKSRITGFTFKRLVAAYSSIATLDPIIASTEPLSTIMSDGGMMRRSLPVLTPKIQPARPYEFKSCKVLPTRRLPSCTSTSNTRPSIP